MTNDDTLGIARRVTEEIPASLADVRIDRVVSLVADVSRSAAAALIDAGAVTVDGQVVVAGKERVQQGQTITVDVSQAPGPELPAAQAGGAVDIVHEDESVVVVNKAAGIVVHPGAGNPDGTLVNFLLDLYPEMASAGDPMRPGIVHRLDAGTTGLMVVARTAAAYDSLVAQMTARSVTRVYSALVWGIPASVNGVIDAPIGRDHRDVTRMAVVVDGRASRTHYALEQSFHTPREASLLECRLETGRTHQIRVHLASIGHPVVGDAQYGGARAGIRAGRPMLHARELAFDHPRTGERVSFQAAAPADFAAVVATLR
ncbi:MAG: RluA family pseudouridine synthase [Actinobacteria bacterium]|nr:RluA family pseudouridine synthase [Actinomycetota bacterium]NBR75878.1 RluA family pseudouridine synthase [Actinomycetota bacterium]NBR92158.1 RluA family pseudouridine synthase [Actinomycetota bacterium]NBY58024.1 RluA family pseudouridine synthase [Actinomycetota bacterium]NDC45963.1 RluA family pseudouridine synthase [Actinomycetota bacterium]